VASLHIGNNPMSHSNLYIGLMSGTSADAIDAVLVEFGAQPRLIAKYSEPLSNAIRQQIHALALPAANEIDRMGALDIDLARLFANTSLKLLDQANILPDQVIAIGSHGQTIRHRPPGSPEGCFTLQIGDPNTIAELTGITTVADFRRRDIAAGGQGAPLVPAFHRAIFQTPEQHRVIVNIGGMANLTWLPKLGLTLGFDTGPGNALMDEWTLLHTGKRYDESGAWAATGKINQELLNRLLQHSFFALAAPKSTGREAFNRQWLDQALAGINIPANDVQATLLELTAITISDAITALSTESKAVFVCGGGAYNSHLMRRLQALLTRDKLDTTATLGVNPQWVEAMAFAWLAQQTMSRQPVNLKEVTGANREVILGGVYYA
jgi:anhydro-N-acetylmuramic acid kinase